MVVALSLTFRLPIYYKLRYKFIESWRLEGFLSVSYTASHVPLSPTKVQTHGRLAVRASQVVLNGFESYEGASAIQ